MRLLTAQTLHEARVARDGAEARFTAINSMTAFGAHDVFLSAELAVKAVLVERDGTFRREYHNHRLRKLAEIAAVWDQLPAEMQSFLVDISAFDPEVRYPSTQQHTTLLKSTTPQWKNRLTKSRDFVDFIEHNVITK